MAVATSAQTGTPLSSTGAAIFANGSVLEVDDSKMTETEIVEDVSRNFSFSDQPCTCCPYGYHIDLDFLRYLDSIYSGDNLKSLKKLKRVGRESLTSPPPLTNQEAKQEPRRQTENLILVSDNVDVLTTEMVDGGETRMCVDRSSISDGPKREKTSESNYRVETEMFISNVQRCDVTDESTIHDSFKNASQVLVTGDVTIEMSSDDLSSTTSKQSNEVFDALDVSERIDPSSIDLNNISPSVLQAIREQMAASLRRMRILEEQVKVIPTLQARISMLKEENRLLLLPVTLETGDKIFLDAAVGDFSVSDDLNISTRIDVKLHEDREKESTKEIQHGSDKAVIIKAPPLSSSTRSCSDVTERRVSSRSSTERHPVTSDSIITHAVRVKNDDFAFSYQLKPRMIDVAVNTEEIFERRSKTAANDAFVDEKHEMVDAHIVSLSNDKQKREAVITETASKIISTTLETSSGFESVKNTEISDQIVEENVESPRSLSIGVQVGDGFIDKDKLFDTSSTTTFSIGVGTCSSTVNRYVETDAVVIVDASCSPILIDMDDERKYGDDASRQDEKKLSTVTADDSPRVTFKEDECKASIDIEGIVLEQTFEMPQQGVPVVIYDSGDSSVESSDSEEGSQLSVLEMISALTESSKSESNDQTNYIDPSSCDVLKSTRNADSVFPLNAVNVLSLAGSVKYNSFEMPSTQYDFDSDFIFPATEHVDLRLQRNCRRHIGVDTATAGTVDKATTTVAVNTATMSTIAKDKELNIPSKADVAGDAPQLSLVTTANNEPTIRKTTSNVTSSPLKRRIMVTETLIERRRIMPTDTSREISLEESFTSLSTASDEQMKKETEKKAAKSYVQEALDASEKMKDVKEEEEETRRRKNEEELKHEENCDATRFHQNLSTVPASSDDVKIAGETGTMESSTQMNFQHPSNKDEYKESDRSEAYVDQEALESIIHQNIEISDTLKKQCDMNSNVLAACSIYNEWINSPDKVTDHDKNCAYDLIKKMWFMTCGQKSSSISQVGSFLSSLDSFSISLVRTVINMADSDGNTALHYAVSYSNTDIVALLLETGLCEVNHENRAGYTAIMLAALLLFDMSRHGSIIRRLFESGDVNSTSSLSGQTALMLAASHGRNSTVGLLLEFGGDVNARDEDGSTALMCASEHGHIDIIKTLLSHESCDSTLSDVDGSTALSIAMDEGYHDIGVLLYAHMKAYQRSRLEEDNEELEEKESRINKI